MKKLVSIMAMIIVIAIIIVACKDNFNESDFLKLQSSLKNQQDTSKLKQQIKALNDAGELLSFTVLVVEDRTPLAGVDVTISNDVTNSALSTKVTTDANGNAVFNKVRVGSNTLLLSKTGYISATAVVDFGTLSNGTYWTLTTGANGATNIVPLKQSRSVLLPVFAKGGTGSTATITGKVTIETDLTNKTPEIPQNLTIRANYASGIADVVQGNSGVDILSYSFSQAGVGVANVDNTTGAYSMTVPATAAGLTMSMLLPTIETNQKVAVINLDGTPIATGPQYRNVPTSFGPGIAADSSIPSVPGAMVVLPSPPAPGAGLSFTFSPVPGPLSSSTWDSYSAGISPNEGDARIFDLGNAAYQLTSRGSGYISSPIVTLTGGGTSPVPTQATMKASIVGYLTGLTIGAGGTSYVNGDVVNVDFRFKDVANVNHSIMSFNSTATVSGGAITAIALPTSGYGIDLNDPFRTVYSGPSGYSVSSFDVVISGGTGTGATAGPVFTGMVDAIKLENAGKNYTSAPTITFSGGGSSNQASLMIKEFRTQWYVTLDNAGNISPYSIMPDDIAFEFSSFNNSPFENSYAIDQFDNTVLYYDLLTVSNGKVVQGDPTFIFHTNSFSGTPPKPIVTSSLAINAKATVTITDGFVTSLGSTTGGRGYNTEFTATIMPTISGAPGTGAALDLGTHFNFDNLTGEYAWDGNASILNRGSGYLTDLNQQSSAPINTGAYGFIGSTANFSIKTNDVQVFNFSYGTGKRKENVD